MPVLYFCPSATPEGIGLRAERSPPWLEATLSAVCKSRICATAKFIPLERLALSPQCGFASTEEGNLLTEADQEAKLRLVAGTAREVWGATRSSEVSKVKGKSV